MDLQKNIGNAFEYAKGLFKDLGRLVIIIILNLIPIVNFIVTGYYAKCIKETPESASPPQLTDYGYLWIQGVKVFVVALIYMIVPLALIMFMYLSFGISAVFFPAALVNWALFASIGLIGIVLAFIASLLLAMGLVNMVKKDDFGKAFAIHEILEIIRNVGWGSYIVWILVLFIIAGILGLIGIIPFVGWLITLIISPAYGVFAARSATLVYLEGAEKAGLAPGYVPPTTITTSTKYCMHCGAEIPADAEFCPKCGQKPQRPIGNLVTIHFYVYSKIK
ncbi:MAG: DUF4013 domain-containing protein [Candidatus Bathyarchaeia archaeon]